ncbi:hypothetical protein GIB67_031823 [Kingdonia uniflora]|uniref:Uncharacterized protein n=1 Tax=Kingdonia uniflora TaxID=39325 RepID=A0A7J7L4Q8_9MAGN|nr:hypothetical protein GIB67_031823 [Kingdonia uniflora]
MKTSIDIEMSTSGRSIESEHVESVNVKSDREDEVVLVQYPDFPDKLVSYPPNSDVFREFCKSKALVGGKWGNIIEYDDRQFRGCIVASGEVHFFLLPDLKKEKLDRGVDESISLEYIDGNVRGDLSEGFSYYLSQLEYGLSLPHNNLVKGIMNIVKAYLAQLNGNMWGQVSSEISEEEDWEGWLDLQNHDEWKVEKTINKRRIDPLAKVMGAKVRESRPAEEDELRAIEDWVRLIARKGVEELSASAQLELSRMTIHLLKAICLEIEEGKAELENGKVELDMKVARLKSDLALEGERLVAAKAAQKVLISELTVEAQKNLNDIVVQRDRLGRQLLVVGYTKADIKANMAGTFVEEDEVEEDVPTEEGVVTGLDGELKDMRLRIEELENELAKEKDTSTSLLTLQAELQVGEEHEIFNLYVKLKIVRLSEQQTLQCNPEFVKEFDWIREATEDREDQHVKASMVRYRIQSLEVSEKSLQDFVASLKGQVTRKMDELWKARADLANSISAAVELRSKLTRKENELGKARADLTQSESVADQLSEALHAKDMNF